MGLALICGTGDLPGRIVAAQDTRPLICVLEGFDPEGLDADLTFRLETIGSLLVDLKDQGVDAVCLCGGIDRPTLDPGKLDANTQPLVPILAGALQSGDDGALRAVATLFETKGFTVKAAHDLVDDLVAPPGVLTDAWPDEAMGRDAELGAGILAALAPFDVAQACVVGSGQLLGVETVAGTDALIKALPEVSATGQGILVKGPKLGQDKRVDMPTVGPETVSAVRAAGLRGIVVDAGEVIVLERARVIELCNAAGLVFWSRQVS